jgi:hypothetical protein
MLLRKKPDTLRVVNSRIQSVPYYSVNFVCSWTHSWYWNWASAFSTNVRYSECWSKKMQSQYTWTGII